MLGGEEWAEQLDVIRDCPAIGMADNLDVTNCNGLSIAENYSLPMAMAAFG